MQRIALALIGSVRRTPAARTSPVHIIAQGAIPAKFREGGGPAGSGNKNVTGVGERRGTEPLAL